MKKPLVLLSFILLSYCSVLAQSVQEKQVQTAIETWKNAVLTRNEAALRSILAEELSYGHSSGLIETKAEFLDVILNRKSVFETLEMPDMEIKIVGNTAVVRNKMFADVVTGGVRNKTNLGVLQVWTRGQNGWQLLARQGFKL
ncbi:nuclear transport factor 2 family protein [Telluribacter sp.]|jgi:ketosteroid isomerase-like protein|uniref:nuclear transport factor 2 family protein n=1 Tax=Telluribacter sp. TaxID=1978767 RepID=UPI002E0E8E6C|nr:nuclear transport factor 2 family protein [Telluribacter sp.]